MGRAASSTSSRSPSASARARRRSSRRWVTTSTSSRRPLQKAPKGPQGCLQKGQNSTFSHKASFSNGEAHEPRVGGLTPTLFFFHASRREQLVVHGLAL